MSLLKSLTDRARAIRGQSMNPRSVTEIASPTVNLIQTPDIARKLVTRFGIREKSPSPTLASEVVPVVLVDDLIGESDLIVPRIKPCAGGGFIPNANGALGIGLVNPAGSGMVLHVYYFWVNSAAAFGYNIMSADALAFDFEPAGGDGYRNQLLEGTTPVGKTGNFAAGPVNVRVLGGGRSFSGVAGIIPFDFVVDEGDMLCLYQTAALVATDTWFTFVWSEESKH